MRALATAAMAAGLLSSMMTGASAHYVPGGYGYYGHGPQAAQRFYQCEHFTCNSGCCPIGYSWYPGGYCGWHVMNGPLGRRFF